MIIPIFPEKVGFLFGVTGLPIAFAMVWYVAIVNMGSHYKWMVGFWLACIPFSVAHTVNIGLLANPQFLRIQRFSLMFDLFCFDVFQLFWWRNRSKYVLLTKTRTKRDFKGKINLCTKIPEWKLPTRVRPYKAYSQVSRYLLYFFEYAEIESRFWWC